MYLSLLLPDVHVVIIFVLLVFHVFMVLVSPGFDRRDAPRQGVVSVECSEAVHTALSAGGHVSLPPLAWCSCFHGVHVAWF
jgi:hypothetical protein